MRTSMCALVRAATCAVLLAAVFLLTYSATAEERAGAESQWWNRQKIRFGWGQWSHVLGKSGLSVDEIMRNLSRAGLTVYVEYDPGCNPERGRQARKHGMRYFATGYICYMPDVAEGAPPAVDKDGREVHYCPLYKPLYERWFLKPALEAAKSGAADGFHTDWEAYGDRGVQVPCFCDTCFGAFMKKRGLQEEIAAAQRYQWLAGGELIPEYFTYLEEETAAMFRTFAEEVRKVNPDFIFSAYGGYDANRVEGRWRMYGLARGLTAIETPFLLLDHRFYWDDHERPWWYSFYGYHRTLGVKVIGGTWDNSLFGGRPDSDVSAAQVLYDLAVNTDGHWLWFAQEPSPALYQAWGIANRRIAAVERKVGEFLLRGEQDINFVTPVVWSGNPELQKMIIQRTYHLAEEHLVHVNNVDTDRPVTVRVKMGRLPEASRWVVRDPMNDLVYVYDEGEAVWDAGRLAQGLVVSLAKRSELWLKLSPAPGDFKPEPGSTIASADIKAMPGH